MRLVSFTQAQRTRIGLQNDAGIVDLSNASPDLPDSMSEFLLQGAEAMSKAVQAGRQSFLAGRMPSRLEASPSSPLNGLIKNLEGLRILT